ncbi:MAG: hypothetical protein RL757_1152 [Bacteroidota bacterium]|jgi:hypothetical protein
MINHQKPHLYWGGHIFIRFFKKLFSWKSKSFVEQKSGVRQGQ